MSPTLTLILYCLAIIAASLLGGWLPMLVRLTHKRMELALSFVSGVMVGVATLLLLPHACSARLDARPMQLGDDPHMLAHDILGPVMLSLLAGFLTMFLIERFFCFHHHDVPAASPGSDEQPHEHTHHACGHDHHHQQPAAGAKPAHALRWGGAAIGLTLHSLLDGVALAASVAAVGQCLEHDHALPALAGLGTFLVVLLHKPFDAMTVGTLLAASHAGKAMRHLVNLAFALLTPIGAGLFMLGVSGEGEQQSVILSVALAFAAGTFLCIALSDLLPELQFHQHDRVKLSLALVLGLAAAWGVAELEARTHVHGHDHEHVSPTVADPHAGHRH